MRLRSEDKHHLRKSADRKAQISSVSGTNARLICAFRSADFLRWCLSSERNLTHNLFFYFQQFLVLIRNGNAPLDKYVRIFADYTLRQTVPRLTFWQNAETLPFPRQIECVVLNTHRVAFAKSSVSRKESCMSISAPFPHTRRWICACFKKRLWKYIL